MAEGVRKVKPTEWQKRVLLSNEKYHVALLGGRGPGKSHAIAFLILQHLERYKDKARCLFVRRSFPGALDFVGICRSLMVDAFGQQATYNQATHVWTLPYGYFFGPDWDFLSSSVAIGADFSLFTMESEGDEEARAIVLGAVVAQIELARFEIAQWSVFNAFSAYIEGQFWFISSDVEGGIKPKIAFGIRSEVF